MQDLEKEKFSQIYVISLLEDFVQENKEAENVLQKLQPALLQTIRQNMAMMYLL